MRANVRAKLPEEVIFEVLTYLPLEERLIVNRYYKVPIDILTFGIYAFAIEYHPKSECLHTYLRVTNDESWVDEMKKLFKKRVIRCISYISESNLHPKDNSKRFIGVDTCHSPLWDEPVSSSLCEEDKKLVQEYWHPFSACAYVDKDHVEVLRDELARSRQCVNPYVRQLPKLHGMIRLIYKLNEMQEYFGIRAEEAVMWEHNLELRYLIQLLG